MSSSNLKTFAQGARRELRKQVGLRLDFVLGTDSAELRQRAEQVKVLKEALEKEGRDGLIERVAYTWFNRLAALRFMDANGYHPFGVRVITPASEQETMPELLQHARAGALDSELRAQLDTAETFDGVLSGAIPTSSREGTAYRMLLIAACHYYHRLMPFLFEQLGDATELLLPDDLLTERSVVHSFRSGLTDEDCREVETLGWFYQFYVSEKKEEVDARKLAIPKEDIPAVTQLFTPHWIVRYLVENSLGRLWLLNHQDSKLREKMPYYIECGAEKNFLKISKPEDIRLLDPAGGSGHMLTYAFDLLYAIYEEEGYDILEIPGAILRNNLYGVDICDRAVALAAFALCMKARAKDNRLFRRIVQPHLISLQDVRFEEGELRDYIQALDLGDLFNQPMLKLLHQFEEAKNFGSLIQPCLDEQALAFARRSIATKDLGSQLFLRETHLKVQRVLEQAEMLSPRYHVVVANPPYMGFKKMNGALRKLGEAELKECARDLFAMFIQRSIRLRMVGGIVAMITMDSWISGDDFNDLRSWLYENASLLTMAHLGPHAFDTIQGEVVQAAAFVTAPWYQLDFKAVYIRLVDESPSSAKEAVLLSGKNRFHATIRSFLAVPRKILAYQATEHTLHAFASGQPLRNIAEAFTGLQTGDNPRFIRFWHEVGKGKIRFGCSSRTDARETGARWFPYVKGSNFRKWYGNNYCVLDWLSDGSEIRQHPSSTVRNSEYYFRAGLGYNNIANSFSVRSVEQGFICDQKNSMFFAETSAHSILALGLLNSSVMNPFLEILSPKDFNPGSLKILPVLPRVLNGLPVHAVVTELVSIARCDWDNFETSWDFSDQPLLRQGLKGATLKASWQNWEAQSTDAIRRMQDLETENNRLFIAAYGLDGDIQPEVPEDQITVARAEVRKDMTAFLSYAVGCMFGRYSLDQPGLILVDEGATMQDYLQRIARPTFSPDADGILPVLDGEWFNDDIVARFSEFLRVTYGEETRSANLSFIEASLGKDLRKHFTRDFYKNHLSNERAYGYKKRPIYWMVSSPEGSFQALIYLHRYTRDTVNTLLNEYVREFIGKLDAHQKQLTAISLNESARSSDRTKAAKESAKIDKMLKELRAWERDVVLPLAQQRIDLDLDDGVKVNYLKFPGLLVPIPSLEKKEEE